MDYPIKLTKDDNDTLLVTFPDFPEALTYGNDVSDALVHAQDVLETVVDAYVKDRRDIPVASRRGKYRVLVPALTESKIRLYQEMRAAKVNKSELARRLQVHLPQVDRLLAMKHGSQLEQIEAAFHALGKRLVLQVEDGTSAKDGRRPRKRKSELRQRRSPTAGRSAVRKRSTELIS